MIFFKHTLNRWLSKWIRSSANFKDGISAPSAYLIQENDTKSRSVYANRNFKKNEVVEHAPLILIERPFDDLPNELKQIVFDWETLANITYPCQAIALGLGNLYRHSNQPNLSFIANTEEPSIVFAAIRKISQGEELTIDYRQAGGKSHLLEPH